jgi:glycosyltransferase involved in cell wall biosynthesis
MATGRGTPQLVSVIIPCRNGAATLDETLDALAAQTYRGRWEVVFVDNGSTDGSAELARRRSAALPSLTVHTTTETGVSRVRNAGVTVAEGDLLALIDADDVPVDRWLEALVDAAADADVVGCALDDVRLNPPRTVHWRGALPVGEPLIPLGHLPMAPGSGSAIWRDVFDALGGWDPVFVAGSDDVDFSWRAQQSGFRVTFAPDAVVAYRYRDGLGPLCRQFFRYGATEALLYRRHRVDGIGPFHVVDLVRTWGRLLRKSHRLVRGSWTAGEWLREASYHLGRARGSIRHRVLLP